MHDIASVMIAKMFISLVVSLCLLQGVLGAAITTSIGGGGERACSDPSLGGFILYAQIKGSRATYPVRLLANAGTPAVSHMVVSIDEDCKSCGEAPGSWTLSKKIVTANLVNTPEGYQTINQAVSSNASPSFITTPNDKVTYPIYCAVGTPSVSTIPVYLLSVNGTASKWYMCGSSQLQGLYTIIYDNLVARPIGTTCFPVNLVMQRLIPIEPGPA